MDTLQFPFSEIPGLEHIMFRWVIENNIWFFLVVFRNLVMNVPKGMNQSCFEALPCWHCLASSTGHNKHVDCLNAIILVKHLTRLVHSRSCWPSRALRRTGSSRKGLNTINTKKHSPLPCRQENVLEENRNKK